MKLLRLPDVLERVALERSALYERIKAGAFPAPTKLGSASVWLESDVDEWICELMGRAPKAGDHRVPVFNMRSHSSDPANKSCSACWVVGNHALELELDDSAKAFAINDAITAAFKAGELNGERRVAFAVGNVVKAFQ